MMNKKLITELILVGAIFIIGIGVYNSIIDTEELMNENDLSYIKNFTGEYCYQYEKKINCDKMFAILENTGVKKDE